MIDARDGTSQPRRVVHPIIRVCSRSLMGSRTDRAARFYPGSSSSAALGQLNLMVIASSSCDQAVSTSRQLDDGYAFSPKALLLSISARLVSSTSFSFTHLSYPEPYRTSCPTLHLAPFLRQIVQNTGPRNTLGDLHTIEESDGQFSEGSGVVATRDSCHDVLTGARRRARLDKSQE